MNRTTTTRSLAVLAAAALVVAACGGDDDDDDAAATTRRLRGADADGGETTGTTGGTGGGGAVDLSACPDPLVIQTDWFPEAEHGGALPDGRRGLHRRHRQQGRRAARSSPAARRPGIEIEIRTGGPAIG